MNELNLISFTDFVTIINFKGFDEWGKPLKQTEIKSDKPNAKIFYNTKREKINTANGEEVQFTASIYFNPLTKISYIDEVFFVDEFGASFSKNPISINYKRDFGGNPLILKVVI